MSATASKEYPVKVAEDTIAQPDSGRIVLGLDDLDYDEVYSYQEQRKIIRRM